MADQVEAEEGGKLNVSVQDENDVMMDKAISNENQQLSLKSASSTERNLYPGKMKYTILINVFQFFLFFFFDDSKCI